MTFRQMRLSLLLIAEEKVGAPRYREAVQARAIEDAKAAAAAAAAEEPDGVR